MNDIPSLPSPHHFGQMMVRARGCSLRRQVHQGYRFLEAPHAQFHLALWAPEHGGGTRKGAWNSGCLGWPLFHCEQICDSKGYWPTLRAGLAVSFIEQLGGEERAFAGLGVGGV